MKLYLVQAGDVLLCLTPDEDKAYEIANLYTKYSHYLWNVVELSTDKILPDALAWRYNLNDDKLVFWEEELFDMDEHVSPGIGAGCSPGRGYLTVFANSPERALELVNQWKNNPKQSM